MPCDCPVRSSRDWVHIAFRVPSSVLSWRCLLGLLVSRSQCCSYPCVTLGRPCNLSVPVPLCAGQSQAWEVPSGGTLPAFRRPRCAEPDLPSHCFLALCVDFGGLGAGSSFLQQGLLDPIPSIASPGPQPGQASETQPAEEARVIPLPSKDVKTVWNGTTCCGHLMLRIHRPRASLWK